MSHATPDAVPADARTDSRHLNALRQGLEGVLLRDRPTLEKRLGGLARRLKEGKPVDRGLAEVEQALARSRERVARRAARPVTLNYPPELPVVERREDILAALRDHQVVVVAGETGSGKTTQLPKEFFLLYQQIYPKLKLFSLLLLNQLLF